MHLLEAKRQGGNGSIKFRWYNGIPGYIIYIRNVKNIRLVDFAGGIYSSIILITLALIFRLISFPIYFSLMLVGVVNFFYGIYEGIFIRKMDAKSYMKFHYLIYLMVTIIYFIEQGGNIVSYLLN